MNTSPMLTIEQLSVHYARPGRLEWIGFRSRRRGPVTPAQTVELIQDRGLEGDHSAAKSGGRRQVTLIQWEHLAVIAGLCGESSIAPERLRRNLAISGVNLVSLRTRRFRLGDALLEGTGHCLPYSRMELELGRGGFNAMRGHGGITARILTGGVVSLGAPLVPVD
jgi:MOSC domain-containing protein YiiM